MSLMKTMLGAIPKDQLIKFVRPHLPMVLALIRSGIAEAAGAAITQRTGVLLFDAPGPGDVPITMAKVYALNSMDEPTGEAIGTVDVLALLDSIDLANLLEKL